MNQPSICRSNLQTRIAMVQDDPDNDLVFDYARQGLMEMIECSKGCVGCPLDDPCLLESKSSRELLALHSEYACLATLNEDQLNTLAELTRQVEAITSVCDCPIHAVYNAR